MAELYQSTDLALLSDSIERASADASPSNPYMVNVCGPSASGKSTLARRLSYSLPDGRLVTMDRYLSEGLWDTTRTFNHESPDPERPYIGGISPEIWDMPLMEEQIVELKNGNAVTMPVFDEQVKDRIGYDPFQPASRIVVEGGHSFSPPFVDMADFKVLVEAPLHGRLIRKLVRTCVVYGLDEGDEILSRYLTKDEPVNRHYLDERNAQADAVIANPLDPFAEFSEVVPRPIRDGKLYQFKSTLVPKADTGKLLSGEELVVAEHKQLLLTYRLLGRLIVSSVIVPNTLDLLLDFYDERDQS